MSASKKWNTQPFIRKLYIQILISVNMCVCGVCGCVIEACEDEEALVMVDISLLSAGMYIF